MKISAVQNIVQNQNTSFKRQLTKQEKREYSKLAEESKRKLGIGTSAAILFDFSLPKKNYDMGIGSICSEEAQRAGNFLKTMFGVNTLQLGPEGQISNLLRSPYSAGSFSLGMHIIDLNKLTENKYGNILNKHDLKTAQISKSPDKSAVDYDNVFDEKGQKAMLQKAYDNFTMLKPESALKKEYAAYKKVNKYWLEPDSLFESAAVLTGRRNIETWPAEYRNVYKEKGGNPAVIEVLKQVTDKDGRNISDFEQFVQFIADKQLNEAKTNFNRNGIKLLGDCQNGFSQKDVWTHPNAFSKNLEFGCDIGYGKFSCWSPAFDFDKLNSDSGQLLYDKFNLFFKRFNGVRIDAAWQLVKPLLLKAHKNKEGEDVFDENGNKLGYPVYNQPYAGDKIIKDILLKAAGDNGVSAQDIYLEMLGGNAYDSLDSVKNTGMKLTHITKYGKDSWGRVKFYEAHNPNNKYQNMKPGDYIIGPGTHDDESLISQFGAYRDERAWQLGRDLGLSPAQLQASQSKWTDAVFAELFTTADHFVSIPDILGEDRRINTPGVQNGCWTYRMEPDYQKKYFENVSQGRGLNLPDALSKALKSKGIKSALTDRLDYYADILREPEPEGSRLNAEI